jgi:hypothetical protein
MTVWLALTPGLDAQKPFPPIPVNTGFPPVEPVSVWLRFFQTHSGLLDRAQKRAAGNPATLPYENSRAARHFKISDSTHAKIIPVTKAFSQGMAPLAAQQKSDREAIQAHKQAASRQHYLDLLNRRDKLVLDSVTSLMRTLSPAEFKQLKQSAYTEFAEQSATLPR